MCESSMSNVPYTSLRNAASASDKVHDWGGMSKACCDDGTTLVRCAKSVYETGNFGAVKCRRQEGTSSSACS